MSSSSSAPAPPPLFSAFRFVFLTSLSNPTVKDFISKYGSSSYCYSYTPPPPAAAMSDAILGLADRSRLHEIDPALLEQFCGRIYDWRLITDSVRRRQLQPLTEYRIMVGNQVKASSAAMNANSTAIPLPSPSLPGIAAAPSSMSSSSRHSSPLRARPSARASVPSSAASPSSVGSAKKRKASATEVPADGVFIESCVPSPACDAASAKKARLQQLASTTSIAEATSSAAKAKRKSQEQRDSASPAIGAATQATEEQIPPTAPSQATDERLPPLEREKHAHALQHHADEMSTSREQRIQQAVQHLQAQGFSIPLIVHALLITSGSMKEARQYLHHSLPENVHTWTTDEDQIIGGSDTKRTQALIKQLGAERVGQRIAFMQLEA